MKPKFCPDCRIPLRPVEVSQQGALCDPSETHIEWKCPKCHGRDWPLDFSPEPDGG